MTDESWHVLTVKEGVVSLLKDLTYEQARAVMQRIGPHNDPWGDDAVRQAACVSAGTLQKVPSGHFMVTSGAHQVHYVTQDVWTPWRHTEFGRVECWGPEGAEMVVWPKRDDYDERLKKALAEEWAKRAQSDEAERIVAETNKALEIANAHR